MTPDEEGKDEGRSNDYFILNSCREKNPFEKRVSTNKTATGFPILGNIISARSIDYFRLDWRCGCPQNEKELTWIPRRCRLN